MLSYTVMLFDLPDGIFSQFCFTWHVMKIRLQIWICRWRQTFSRQLDIIPGILYSRSSSKMHSFFLPEILFIFCFAKLPFLWTLSFLSYPVVSSFDICFEMVMGCRVFDVTDCFVTFKYLRLLSNMCVSVQCSILRLSDAGFESADIS